MTRDISVLLIEDFKPFLDWTRARLQQASFSTIWEAASAAEAYQKARKLNPDLIVLDIGLPDLNGIDACKGLRSLVPSATFLFLTACNDPEVAGHALDTGANAYVLKSDAERELLPAIRTVLDGKIFVSSGLNAQDANSQRAISFR